MLFDGHCSIKKNFLPEITIFINVIKSCNINNEIQLLPTLPVSIYCRLLFLILFLVFNIVHHRYSKQKSKRSL